MLSHELHDYEAPVLIENLIEFLGEDEVNKALKKYKRAKLVSGPIYRENYLKFRHPWWESFLFYIKMKKNNLLHLHYNSPEIMRLCLDSKLINNLKTIMPTSVINKFKKDLLDDENAINYLFELKSAWHYHRLGLVTQWIEDIHKKNPEFLLKKNNITVEVECKRIGVDASRKIKRPTFYRFCDQLFPIIQRMNLTGKISIAIPNNLSSNDNDQKDLCEQIVLKIKGQTNAENPSSQFSNIDYNLTKKNGIIVNPNSFVKNVQELNDPNSHTAIGFYETGNKPTDPIIITMKSESSDDYVGSINSTIKRASKKQLSTKRPGIINCFLPEIPDFSALLNKGGLKRITTVIFTNRNYNHLLSISFISDELFVPTLYGKITNNPAAMFKNPYCRFKKAMKLDIGLLNTIN